MIRAVVFDLDGVLRHWPPHGTRAIERRFGMPPGAIDRGALAPALLERAVVGSITDVAWRREVADRLEALDGRSARNAVDEWSRLRGKVDQAVLDLVRDVRRGAPVALLPNATTRLPDDLTALGLAGEFDVIRQLRRPSPAQARSRDLPVDRPVARGHLRRLRACGRRDSPRRCGRRRRDGLDRAS